MPTTVLSNLERRATANLSIPRNIPDLAHMLRMDPHAPTLTDEKVHDLLVGYDQPVDEDDPEKGTVRVPGLAELGLVVNLGQHDDLAKLAASLESHETALAMPDDKAANYVQRLEHASRAWRRSGDLWLLTEEGFAQLVAPDPSHSEYAMTTADLEKAIAKEYTRLANTDLIGSIFDENGGHLTQEAPLANALLSEELAAWVKLVSDEHERQTGERPRLPIAGGAGYSDATELLVLAADTGGTAYGETSPTFLALVTVAVTDADTGSSITEATAATGYVRKSTANSDFSAASAGAHTTVNALTFAAITAGSATVIGFARTVAATVSRLIRFGTCASTVISATNTPASFAAGAYTDTLD